jgi:hypothetical protein
MPDDYRTATFTPSKIEDIPPTTGGVQRSVSLGTRLRLIGSMAVPDDHGAYHANTIEIHLTTEEDELFYSLTHRIWARYAEALRESLTP